MHTTLKPEIGEWFKHHQNGAFEVVALDAEDQTIEIQYFDGTIEELEIDSWLALEPLPIEAPEDYSGSLDITGQDYGVDRELEPANYQRWQSMLRD